MRSSAATSDRITNGNATWVRPIRIAVSVCMIFTGEVITPDHNSAWLTSPCVPSRTVQPNALTTMLTRIGHSTITVSTPRERCTHRHMKYAIG